MTDQFPSPMGPGVCAIIATLKPSSVTLPWLPLLMWKAKAVLQSPSVGLEDKGRFGERRQGHPTLQLQFSKYYPAITQCGHGAAIRPSLCAFLLAGNEDDKEDTRSVPIETTPKPHRSDQA